MKNRNMKLTINGKKYSPEPPEHKHFCALQKSRMTNITKNRNYVYFQVFLESPPDSQSIIEYILLKLLVLPN